MLHGMLSLDWFDQVLEVLDSMLDGIAENKVTLVTVPMNESTIQSLALILLILPCVGFYIFSCISMITPGTMTFHDYKIVTVQYRQL